MHMGKVIHHIPRQEKKQNEILCVESPVLTSRVWFQPLMGTVVLAPYFHNYAYTAVILRKHVDVQMTRML